MANVKRMLLGLVTLGVAAVANAAPPPKPRLVVAIAVDQFSAALFAQYRGRFTGGLKMLASGVVNANGYQNHAATETCPGHSTILSGRNPKGTGIVANQWYDAELGRQMYCVEDPAGPVPGRDTAPRGPANLKASTLGEWLKAVSPASRVFAVSGKDRGAITMAGRNADGVFWWDDERGFNTYVPAGTTAAARLAPVARLNAALAKRWAVTPPVWTPSGACRAGGSETFGSLTIDHRLPPPGYDGDWTEAQNLRYFRATPGLDQVTLDAARELVERFRLGRGTAPDVLAISLSATDYVGHRYGGGGPEMCDQLVQLDRMLGAFLDMLSAAKIDFVVVLTADHGALDAVERVARAGIPATRLTTDPFAEVGRALQEEFRLEYFPFAGDAQQISIAGFGERDAGLDAKIAASALARLRARPEVAAAYGRAEIVAAAPRPGTPPDELSLAERFHNSFDPARSGDIQVAYRPYSSGGAATIGYVAGHGSPWQYDRRVPILFWWPGAIGFEQSLPVATADIAPSLAALLGITPPADLDGRCLDLDGGAGDSCAKR
jgi:predicted AlkP superfamily pyrophosphatase or phosphodiesterase